MENLKIIKSLGDKYKDVGINYSSVPPTLVVRRLIQEGNHMTKDNFATPRKGLDCVSNGELTDGNLLPRSDLYFSFRREACSPA